MRKNSLLPGMVSRNPGALARHSFTLLLGSGVLASLSHQGCDKGAEEGFAAAPSVVHELEEAEIERQLLLRDAPVRAQPRAQQGPRPLHGIDVDLAEAVAILVARVFATGVADRLVPIA